MVEVTDQEFNDIVTAAIDGIPDKYAAHIKNLGFVVEDDPNEEQRTRLHLVNGVTLYGLYEGVPLPARGANYSGVLPDKITLFKGPITRSAQDHPALIAQIKNTVWHEVAHYFGLGHGRIHDLENKEAKE